MMFNGVLVPRESVVVDLAAEALFLRSQVFDGLRRGDAYFARAGARLQDDSGPGQVSRMTKPTLLARQTLTKSLPNSLLFPFSAKIRGGVGVGLAKHVWFFVLILHPPPLPCRRSGRPKELHFATNTHGACPVPRTCRPRGSRGDGRGRADSTHAEADERPPAERPAWWPCGPGAEVAFSWAPSSTHR
jgi:hypothetical protein